MQKGDANPEHEPLKGDGRVDGLLMGGHLTKSENAIFWKLWYNSGWLRMRRCEIGLSKRPRMIGGKAVNMTLNMAIVQRSKMVTPEKAEKKANQSSMM
jgi:hypothetical protein